MTLKSLIKSKYNYKYLYAWLYYAFEILMLPSFSDVSRGGQDMSSLRGRGCVGVTYWAENIYERISKVSHRV